MRRGARSLSGERGAVRRSILAWVLCLSCWSSGGSGLQADEPKAFRAGAYAADITPTRFPISMNGQMRDRPARSALDRLHARCLVLDDGKAPVAIVVVDSCMISRPIFDEAKRR